ncbi:asparaginase domain-containing protein [Halobellus ordinarius]|uniref:asparaginase domain-containing protein n=1 Tax=Halobellus ordinarius TaxID=3075120 RepID=UPI0028808A83|nr:asparaginase domain-containing protein [Halobellus sp. ZY16]
MNDQHIHFITTGGTIDKDYEAGRGVRNFVIGEPAVERMLESLAPPPNFEYSVESVVRKDSLELDDDDREAIAAACEAAPSSRIVITHGTDTIIDTARELPEGPTIVLTGAVRPQRMRGSDAEFNLGTAIGAVQTLDPGTYVAMSGRVYPHDDVRKTEGGQFVER